MRNTIPLRHMVNQMVFHHVAPLANRVQESLFERSKVDSQPRVENFEGFHLRELFVHAFVQFNLKLIKFGACFR